MKRIYLMGLVAGMVLTLNSLWGQGDPLAALGKGRKAGGKTTVTANKLEYDYKKYVALFQGNVRVVDAEFTLTADKVLIIFENVNEVRRIDAQGNVKVVSEDRTATCGKATYTRASGEILLEDQPVVSKGGNTIRGKTITVWLNSNYVEVNEAVQLESTGGSTKF